MSAARKPEFYLRGLVASFEGSTFAERDQTIQTQEQLDDWQNGWCDGHQVKMSLEPLARASLSIALSRLS